MLSIPTGVDQNRSVMSHYIQRLHDAIRSKNTPALVGLDEDPHLGESHVRSFLVPFSLLAAVFVAGLVARGRLR